MPDASAELDRLVARLPRAERPTARRSPHAWRFMAHYFGRFFAKHMNAMRVARWGEPTVLADDAPVVVYANHPAWWDAATFVLAARRYFPQDESYAPIDAEMMEKYPVFGRIGAFGVDLDTLRGSLAFLAASADILSRPRRVMWVACQGRFVDVRERPLGVRAGVARLPELAPNAWFVPLALEYAFWQERGGEAFLAFGEPQRGRDLKALPRAERRDRMEAALTAALDRLSVDVRARDPGRFVNIAEGRAGVGGVYDAWRRLGAMLRGRRFDAAHEDRDAARLVPERAAR